MIKRVRRPGSIEECEQLIKPAHDYGYGLDQPKFPFFPRRDFNPVTTIGRVSIITGLGKFTPRTLLMVERLGNVARSDDKSDVITRVRWHWSNNFKNPDEWYVDLRDTDHDEKYAAAAAIFTALNPKTHDDDQQNRLQNIWATRQLLRKARDDFGAKFEASDSAIALASLYDNTVISTDGHTTNSALRITTSYLTINGREVPISGYEFEPEVQGSTIQGSDEFGLLDD